jgi:hypothetical protein
MNASNNDRNGEMMGGFDDAVELSKSIAKKFSSIPINMEYNIARFIINEGYTRTPPIESGKVPSVGEINKILKPYIYDQHREEAAQAIVTYLEGGKK